MAKLLTGTRIYGTGTVDTQLFVSGTNVSTSTTTGALQVVGGVGVGGDLRVGGTVYGIFNGSITGTATTATNIAGGTPGQVPYQTAAGVTSFYGPGTAGNVLVSNGTSSPSYNNTLTLTGTTVSVSTNTGALQVQGGVGISGNLYVGGTTSSFIGNVGVGTVAPTWKVDANLGSITAGSISTGGYNVTGDAAGSVGYTTYNMQLNNSTANASGYMRLARTASTTYLGMQIGSQSRDGIAFLTGAVTPAESVRISAAGIVTILTATNATSTSTGALIVTGGVGIGGDLFIQGDIATNDTTFNLINATATTVNFAGAATALTVGATSGSTTVRNNLSVTGNLTVQGTTTIVDSTVTNIADPIITLGGGTGNAAPTVDDNKDRGIAFKWVNNGGTTSTGFFGYDDSTGYLTYIQTATITNEVVSGTKGAVDANLAGGAAMSLVYQSAANTTAFLAAGTSGFILQTNGTGAAPTWVNASGIGAGSATNADNIRTISQNTNAVYYPTFVDSNNAANAYESLYTTSTFSINANNGVLTVKSIAVNSNTNGMNILIGDDAWIGDIDQANTFRVMGVQTSTNGFIVFGSSNTLSLGRIGTGPLTYGGDFTVSGTTAATSTQTGALQVRGGVGIGGTLYIGNLRADATTSATTWGVFYNPVTKELTTSTAGSTTSASGTGTTSTFVINNSTAATSTNTGALQVVNGGAGIGGNIYAGGDIYSRGTKVIPLSIQEFTATAGQTTFTISGGYTVGTVQVFANGINLGSADIVASNGTTVVVLEPRAVGDIVRVISGGTSSAMNNAQNFSIAMSIAMSM